ncbi:hypothetical protein TNCV_690471 [Trichonephila clavipes]|nr:hypothetical protein TNCV_690471 [Trichonephila clavipes]
MDKTTSKLYISKILVEPLYRGLSYRQTQPVRGRRVFGHRNGSVLLTLAAAEVPLACRRCSQRRLLVYLPTGRWRMTFSGVSRLESSLPFRIHTIPGDALGLHFTCERMRMILTSYCKASQGPQVTDLLNLNLCHVMRTTPEQAPLPQWDNFEPQPIQRVTASSTRGCNSPVVKVSNHGRHVINSSPVPLKTRPVGERCSLNPSRAQTSSRGVVVRRGGTSSGVVLVT